MAKSAAELGATDDAVEKKVERAYATWRDELVACIKEAQRDGTVGAKQNPQALAEHPACVHARPGGPVQGRREAGTVEGRRRRDGVPDPHRLDDRNISAMGRVCSY